ncbi:unnamed protein product [Closterium sp. Naga37s-1]|nr:unnamed protein product [Closterium sp. Naga37s-1]
MGWRQSCSEPLLPWLSTRGAEPPLVGESRSTVPLAGGLIPISGPVAVPSAIVVRLATLLCPAADRRPPPSAAASPSHIAVALPFTVRPSSRSPAPVPSSPPVPPPPGLPGGAPLVPPARSLPPSASVVRWVSVASAPSRPVRSCSSCPVSSASCPISRAPS